MARQALGPRALRKTAEHIAAQADTYVTEYDDDHTVALFLNRAEEETMLDDFREKAVPGTFVELRITKDGETEPVRRELYHVVATAPANAQRDPVAGEVAGTLKQYNDMLPRLIQSVGDLNNVIQAQAKGQIELAKTMTECLKIASKATKRSAKDRKKKHKKDGDKGIATEAIGFVKEMNGVLGEEKTAAVLMAGFDLVRELFGPKPTPAAQHPDTGGQEAIPREPSGGGDSGADAAPSGNDAVSSGSEVPSAG